MRMLARCGQPIPFGQDTHRTAYCFRNLKSCQNSNFAEIETIWLRALSLGFGNVTVKPKEKIMVKDWFFILYNCFFAIENFKFWFRDDNFPPQAYRDENTAVNYAKAQEDAKVLLCVCVFSLMLGEW